VEKEILPPYSAEQLMEMAGKYIGQWPGVKEHDREDAEAVFVAAGIEALTRFDSRKSEGGARGYQMSWAMGQVKNYFRHRSETCGAENVSLGKDIAADGKGDRETLADVIPGRAEESPEHREMRERVATAVASLSEQESAVMTGLYFRGLNRRQIAREMGITSSRVAQIEKNATEALRYRLAEYAAA